MEFIPIIFGVLIALSIVGYYVMNAIRLKKKYGGAGRNGSERDKSEKETKKLCKTLSGDELYEKASELVDDEGLKSDYFRWEAFIRTAAEKGNIPAIREWGLYNKNGDNALAVNLLTRAAEAGDEKAVEGLYKLYYYGSRSGKPEIASDKEKAVEVVKPFAEKGNAVSQRLIGDYCFYEENDMDTAHEWYLKAARGNDAEAMIRAAEIYMFKDDEAAHESWLLKAARQNNSEAESMLGTFYECAEPPEYERAMEWYKKAAEHGESTSACSVGEMYLKGEGVQKDESKAFEWFQKAVDMGSVYGQYLLGKCYMEGTGVAKDIAKGIALYTESAEFGSNAQYALGLCYLEGNGVKKDVNKGISYLEQAAERNDEAQNKLAEIYYAGKLVKKDEERAHELWREAAEDDNEEAIKNLKKYFKE